ncbi:MAG: hypothetical protein HDT44_01215 [Ruminococcaceae bacterium]|nr:hypothetical protein [Oscillospiraceae bacterium]
MAKRTVKNIVLDSTETVENSAEITKLQALDPGAEIAEKAENSERKHVALDQLHIIKEYIDRKNAEQNLTGGITGTITDESGVFGLRFYDNKLQYKDTDGKWVDIPDKGAGVDNAEVADDKEVSDIFAT